MMVWGGDQLPCQDHVWRCLPGCLVWSLLSLPLAPVPLATGFAEPACALATCLPIHATLGKCCCFWCLVYFQLGKPQTLALWIILRIRLHWVRSILLVCGTNRSSFSLTCPLGMFGQFQKPTFMVRMSQDSRRGFVLPRHNTNTALLMFHRCGRD